MWVVSLFLLSRLSGGGSNLYEYTGGNPQTYTDPKGKIFWLPLIVFGLGTTGSIAGFGYWFSQTPYHLNRNRLNLCPLRDPETMCGSTGSDPYNFEKEKGNPFRGNLPTDRVGANQEHQCAYS
jgi:hypothetical protein